MSGSQKIERNIIFLKENIDPREMIDIFIQEGLFSFDNSEEINALPTTGKRTEKFLETVCRLGDRGYDLFRRALQQEGREDVVTLLDNTKIIEQENRFDQLSEDEKNMKVSDKGLMRFNNITPTEMDLLAVAMGFTATDVQIIKMENSFSVASQFAKLWMKWKSKYSKKATLGLLTKHIIDAKDSGANVDWSIYEKGKAFVIAENSSMTF